MGYAKAQYTFSKMLTEGFGVLQDHAAALELFRKAASQGHTNANIQLGWAHSKGVGAHTMLKPCGIFCQGGTAGVGGCRLYRKAAR
mmetsp:Transcript_20761/g.52570  ORF Transcript_20761/g.52570 Transcript_20761/m.52570 type:complete len:86 (+) Transcript_20761:182-439(+)